jgi:hypothetical protein
MSESIISFFIRSGIISVVEGVILKGPIETSTIVRGKGETLLQSVDQVRVADKVPTIEEGIVFSRLDHAPRVLIIPAASREEGS